MSTPDFPLPWAWALALSTLGLVTLLVLGLLLLRWVRWREAPRRARLRAQWQALLMQSVVGDPLPTPLPALAERDRWRFLREWLHAQMALQGPCRQRLAALGRAMGCSQLALQRLDSRHPAERLVAVLALGFLGDPAHAPLLLQRLPHAGTRTAVHLSHALLELDAQAHAGVVVHRLLRDPDLDLALVSVLLKPFRSSLALAFMQQPPAPSEDPARTLRWLRLARALRLQLPTPLLSPLLQSGQDPEVLMAAIRMVQGEQGDALVLAHARHTDWRVRVQVARALGHIGGASAADVLLRLVTDAQWWVRYRAAQSLLRLPGVAAAQVIDRIAATGDRYALNMAHAVLAERRLKP